MIYTQWALQSLCLLALVSATLLGAGAVPTSPRPPDHNRGYGPETVKNWAGYIPVEPSRQLWYWFFESRSDPSNDPLVLWLTGGPGCSSLVGMLVEVGPYLVDPHNSSLSLNPHSWNTHANLLFIDQPVGTGFSYAEDERDPGPMTEREIADNLREFLLTFIHQYPKYARAPLFITGESYGGHFIPAAAARIHRGNSEDGPEGQLNLRGIALGNPLIDARHQYEQYAPYARDYKLITPAQFDTMQAGLAGCIDLIKRCSQRSVSGWHACLQAHVLCAYSQLLPVAATGVNVYDVRLRCGDNPLCYDMSHVEKLLARSEVREALGVTAAAASHPPSRPRLGKDGSPLDSRHFTGHSPHHWHECNTRVNEQLALSGDWFLSFASDLPALLAADIRVLVYAGDQDFVCNHYGQRAWLRALEWTGQKDFIDSPPHSWVVEGAVAGRVHRAGPLTYLRVFDAGHMVPADQPSRAHDMLRRFMADESFAHDEHGHHRQQRHHRKPHSSEHGDE